MYRRLLALNGLAILAVVTNHAAGWGIVALFWWTDRYRMVSVPNFEALGTPVYYATSLLQTLPAFSVPAFLFVSGFFVAYAAQGNPHGLCWRSVRIRIVGLVIPYLIWSAVVFVGDGLQGIFYTPAEYLVRLVSSGAYGGYFFVPTLCYFYALSPFLVPWSGIRWKWLLAASALVQLIPVSLAYFKLLGVPIPGLAILITRTPNLLFYALYFPMGIVCGTHIDQLQSWLQAHRRLLLAALAAAAALCLAESELVYQTTVDHWRLGVYSLGLHVYAVAAIMGFLACRDASLAGRKWLAHFGTRSYGIYLLQGPIIEATARVLYHVAPWVLGVQALFQPILFSVALAVPLAFMTAVSRSRLRSFYRYLFG